MSASSCGVRTQRRDRHDAVGQLDRRAAIGGPVGAQEDDAAGGDVGQHGVATVVAAARVGPSPVTSGSTPSVEAIVSSCSRSSFQTLIAARSTIERATVDGVDGHVGADAHPGRVGDARHAVVDERDEAGRAVVDDDDPARLVDVVVRTGIGDADGRGDLTDEAVDVAHVAGVALEQPGAAVVGVGPRGSRPSARSAVATTAPMTRASTASTLPATLRRVRLVMLRPPFAQSRGHPRRGGIGRRRDVGGRLSTAPGGSNWGRVPMCGRGPLATITGARRRAGRPARVRCPDDRSPRRRSRPLRRHVRPGRDANAGSPDAPGDPAAVAGLLRAALRGADDLDARRGADVLGRLGRHLGRRGVRGRQAAEPGVAHVLLRAGLAARRARCRR